jgi:hypothetical protein
MAETKNVEIECAKCGSSNVIPRPWELSCNKCNAPLSSGKYSKSWKTAWAALVFGSFGTYHATNWIAADRYPIQVEHAIIESCISASKRPMARSIIVNKRDVCVCALKKTQDEFDAGAYRGKNKKNEFISTFEANAVFCVTNP